MPINVPQVNLLNRNSINDAQRNNFRTDGLYDKQNFDESIKKLAKEKINSNTDKRKEKNDKNKNKYSNMQNQPQRKSKNTESVSQENPKKGPIFSIKRYEAGDKTGLSPAKKSNQLETRVKTGHRINDKEKSRTLRLPQNSYFPRYNFKHDEYYSDEHYPSRNPHKKQSNIFIKITGNTASLLFRLVYFIFLELRINNFIIFFTKIKHLQ